MKGFVIQLSACWMVMFSVLPTFSEDIPEPWQNPTASEADPAWSGETGSMTLDITNDLIQVSYAEQSGAPAFEEDSIQLIVTNDILLRGVVFDFQAGSYAPSNLRVSFENKTGRRWSHNLSASDTNAVTSHEVSLSSVSGWFSSDGSKAQEIFDTDRRNVQWVGLYIRRNATILAQQYVVSGFQIDALTFQNDADKDLMPDSWEIAHGFDSNNFLDATSDADGDGLSNYGEYLAGADPHDPTQSFVISAIPSQSTATPFSLRWDSFDGRSYDVWRSTNLLAGFERVAVGIPASPPENTFEDTAPPASRQHFYRITVKRVSD